MTLSGAFASRYTGKERDTESGNDYFGARYYGSSMGRFMSPDDGAGIYSDPANPQSWNLYGYVLNNPLSNTDADGHSVNVCSNDANGNQQCTQMSNDQYAAAQQGNNGSLNVPSLNTVGMNGDGNGNFNSTSITDGNGNTVGSATYVSDGPTDYYANANGYATLSNAAGVVNAAGTAEMMTLTPLMPELLTGAAPEVGLGVGGVGAAARRGGGTDPSTPVGRRGNPMNARGSNSPETINGRQYSGHALDQMQGRGVPSSVVENAIQNGTASPGNTPGTTVHNFENVSVVTNQSGGVVTVITR